MQDSSSISDEEIVILSLKDKNYFEIIIKRYESKFSRYIGRMCNCSKEDIEDLSQEIFIKIYRNLNDFDLKLKFSSWAYRIAHNEIISHYRKINARGESVELLPDMHTNVNGDDDYAKLIDRKLDKEKIIKILETMDLKYKDILILRYFEEKDYAEIGDILRKPSGTVATLINRAKKQFKVKAEQLNIDF